ETFAMVTMWFDNWRWSGVPFYIRSGKRLAKRVTEIAIQFKDAPHQRPARREPVSCSPAFP
ncbi:MAG TPA: hypothetical protein VE713_01365, partial [Pyrinomonadaceae bacterium]|nr:hypothetical protein [Pyrinomonadaceae bacterium]